MENFGGGEWDVVGTIAAVVAAMTAGLRTSFVCNDNEEVFSIRIEKIDEVDM